jgi:hypothetical protein
VSQVGFGYLRLASSRFVKGVRGMDKGNALLLGDYHCFQLTQRYDAIHCKPLKITLYCTNYYYKSNESRLQIIKNPVN